MAKVNVIGDAVVFTSCVKLEEYKTVEKYRPDALVLENEDGEPVFKVSTGEGAGRINQYGITFCGQSRDEGYATCTIALLGFDTSEDVKEFITDKYGVAIANLKKIEDGIAQNLYEINEERAAVASSIEIA